MANLCITGLEKLRSIVLTSGNMALAEIAGRDGEQWKLLEEKSVRMENVLRRKFGGFSGPIRLVADLRCTGERYEGLERELSAHVEAVTTGLAGNMGPWGQNLIYSGAYTVKFEPVKLGGRNFIQSAKIELDVEACG